MWTSRSAAHDAASTIATTKTPQTRATCATTHVEARSIQTGYLRAYALLLLLGVAGLTLYFLLNSS